MLKTVRGVVICDDRLKYPSFLLALWAAAMDVGYVGGDPGLNTKSGDAQVPDRLGHQTGRDAAPATLVGLAREHGQYCCPSYPGSRKNDATRRRTQPDSSRPKPDTVLQVRHRFAPFKREVSADCSFTRRDKIS